LVASVFVLAVTLGPSAALAQTQVCGGIFADTTWTVQGSPYELTCDVRVFLDYSLTIEPGVVVRFNPGTTLQIDGTLNALGTPAAPIAFESVDSQNPGDGVYLATNEQGTGAFDYVEFRSFTTALRVECCWGAALPASISNSTFVENGVGIGGYAGSVVTVTACVFDNNASAITNADKLITDSTFVNNDYGLYFTERVAVYDSVFQFNTVALAGGGGNIEGCTITENQTGVQGGFNLAQNTITANGTGVIFTDNSGYVGRAQCNDIFGNSVYNAEVGTSTSFSQPDNWWGSTDPSVIDASIYDGMDAPNLGLLTYSPFLSTPWEQSSVCNACPGDTDCDGVPDDLDNCPSVPNPGQEDCDSDGIGDACDPQVDLEGDIDGDGDVDLADLGALLSNYGRVCGE
jgi:hypothetical protein